MSAAAHLQDALSHSAFETPALRLAVEHLLHTLDKDLDRAGYAPSPETQEGLRELIRVLKKVRRDEASSEEEERDVDRLS
jgi:hypothetical protein